MEAFPVLSRIDKPEGIRRHPNWMLFSKAGEDLDCNSICLMLLLFSHHSCLRKWEGNLCRL
jgi:hypothetical protein